MQSKNWHSTDKTAYEGRQLESLTSQVIRDPTHILESNSSCIDLVFTSQPNLVMTSGVHSSLLRYYHHEKMNEKFKLKIVFAPPYE